MKFFFVFLKIPGDQAPLYSSLVKKKKEFYGKIRHFGGNPLLSSIHGGGGGSNFKWKQFFWEDDFKKINIIFFLIICLGILNIVLFLGGRVKNSGKKDSICYKNFFKESWFFRIITGKCELLPCYFFCIFLKNFSIEKISLDHQERVVSGVNRWYNKRNFIYSNFNSEKKFSLPSEKKNIYISEEPRIGRIEILTKRTIEKRGFFKENKTRFFFLKKIFKIYPGLNFNLDKKNWDRCVRENLLKDGKVYVKSYKKDGNNSFLDVFVTVSETSSRTIEPAIFFSNDCLSGSISANDTNFLGLGLIFNNKFTKIDNKRSTFQSQLASHFSDSGKIIINKESEKKGIDKLNLTFSGEIKIVEGSFNFNFLRKKENYSKEERCKPLDIFSISLFPKKIITGRNFFLFNEISIYSVNKIKERISTGLQFFFGTKNKLLYIFQNPTNIEIKILNFLKYQPNVNMEFFDSNTEVFEKELNRYPSWDFKEFRKKTSFEITSIVEKRSSSSIFFDVGIFNDNEAKLEKNISIGIDFKNLLLLNVTLTGNGNKKISLALK